MPNQLPEIVFCTPASWGEPIYVASLEDAKLIIKELRQLGDGFESASIDDLEVYTRRPDGCYEGEGEWTDGFTRQVVPIVTLAMGPNGTLTATESVSEARVRQAGQMVPA